MCYYCVNRFRELSEEEATKAVINNQLPAIARAIRLGDISVDNIDVFCEKGVFELQSSREILEAGRALGLRMNFHADEIFPLGGAEVSTIIQTALIFTFVSLPTFLTNPILTTCECVRTSMNNKLL